MLTSRPVGSLFAPLFYGAAKTPWAPLRTLRLFLPLAGAYGALLAPTRLNLFPGYELYPAVPRAPFVYQVPWVALAAATASGLLVWLVANRLLRGRGRLEADATKALALIVLAALAMNRFAALVFLLAPAVLWPLAAGRRRVVNLLLLLAGAAPFLLITVSFGLRFPIGFPPFYSLLQAAYGAWSPATVLLFAGAAAVALQIATSPRAAGSLTGNP